MSELGFMSLLRGHRVFEPLTGLMGAAGLPQHLRFLPAPEIDGAMASRIAGAVSHTVQCLVERDGEIRSITPNARQVLGHGAEQAVQLRASLSDVVLPLDRGRVSGYLQDLFATGQQQFLCASRTPTGQHRSLELSGRLERSAWPELALVEIRDSTGVAPATSSDTIYHDALTGLPGEALLRLQARQLLALARRRGHTAALLHIDIRRLKAVNESLGRATGDAVLRAVADRLRQGIRESDTLARLTSDEFLVLLSEVAEEEAAGRVVLRLRESLCRPYRLRDRCITLDADIGVALYPRDAGSFEKLAECAAKAMLRAGKTTSGFQFYSRELNDATLQKLSLEDDMRWAWEHDQFVLHYQPICATASGETVGAEALARGDVVGMEALARWPHQERGMIMPADFIPLAERTGRIISLDRWAIAASVKQASEWSHREWSGWVSVNLSTRTLHDEELPGYIERILTLHALPAHRLVVEITESAAMADAALTARVLQALKRVGVRVAIDDFGIGHSSLAYLKHFPVDLLKLDSAFVADIGRDHRNEELLRMMISLAHRIGARVVAEGVEREEQWEWLKRAGCDYVQGYLMGRPAPAERLLSRAM